MTARSVLLGIGILAGPVAVFCVIAALPFSYVSWLGGGFVGIICAMALPGVACILMLKLSWLLRGAAAMAYLAVYVPLCVLPAAFTACMLVGCSV